MQLPGDASFPLRISKSITKFELKLVDKGSSAGNWKVTLGIDKSKALEHKGTLAQISCLLDAATANRLRAVTIPAIPATVSAHPSPSPNPSPNRNPDPNPNPNPNPNQVPIFEQEDETVASSNMSSGNGLLPPMKPPTSAAKKPSRSVPAAATDPFAFELDEAEPRSNGGKASKTAATPAVGKATPKPRKGTSTKENVFDFPADDDGGRAESEAQRPARKQPAQPAPKAPAPRPPAAKQPAAKQPAAKQPAAKQPAAKQPGWVEPAARSGSAKAPLPRVATG